MSGETVKVNLERHLCVPATPNYIRFGEGPKDSVHIKHIDEGALRTIGKLWTDKLLRSAKESKEN